MRWAQLIWPEGKPEEAKYRCGQCEQLIAEHFKPEMLERGRWVAQEPEVTDVAGFHLNALYAPYGWANSWARLAKEWTDIDRQRDRGRLQTFVNTNLAETWAEEGEKVDACDLMNRREVYTALVPHEVLVITAAVDVQDDRLEAEVCGWGQGEESWSIDYKRFYGSPGQAEVWAELDAFLEQTWHTGRGTMRILKVCVDTGGHFTKEAYAFVRPRQGRGLCAVKGSNQPAHALVGRPSRRNLGGVNLFPIGTDTAKNTLFYRFKLDTFGPGYCHFPDLPEYDQEYFAQLTAETKKPKYHRGMLVGSTYVKIRARNEALDLKVMNLAALAIANVNLNALAEDSDQPVRPEAHRPRASWINREADRWRRGSWFHRR